MWLLVVNFIVYVAMNVAPGRLRRSCCPLSVERIDRRRAAPHCAASSATTISRTTTPCRSSPIWRVIVDIVIVILSGLAVWKSVQFPLLRTLMGGYDDARVVHFFAMSFLVAFFVRACRDGGARAALARC